MTNASGEAADAFGLCAEGHKMLRLVEQVDQRRTELASKLVAEGRRAVAPLLQQVEDEDRENPAKEEFQEPLDLFLMALKLEKGKSLEATKALDAMWEAVHTARRHEDRNLRRKQQVEDTELVEAEVEVVEHVTIAMKKGTWQESAQKEIGVKRVVNCSLVFT